MESGMHIYTHAMHAYVDACMPCVHMPTCIRHACICRCGHAGVCIHACECICMRTHACHAYPLAGAAHDGGYLGGGATNPEPWHIYIYIYTLHICMYYIYINIYPDVLISIVCIYNITNIYTHIDMHMYMYIYI